VSRIGRKLLILSSEGTLRVGTEKVSAEQAAMLERAQQNPPTRELYMLLRRVAREEDILSDDETIHPDWESV
jgi:hypothetical protein